MTKLRRNNSKMPLTINGRLRHGQFPHHTAECAIEDYGVTFYRGEMPVHEIWCATHGQWAHETPVEVVWRFEDGTEVVSRREL